MKRPKVTTIPPISGAEEERLRRKVNKLWIDVPGAKQLRRRQVLDKFYPALEVNRYRFRKNGRV